MLVPSRKKGRRTKYGRRTGFTNRGFCLSTVLLSLSFCHSAGVLGNVLVGLGSHLACKELRHRHADTAGVQAPNQDRGAVGGPT